MVDPSDERRQRPRARTLKEARIVFNDRRSVIDCTARNLSASGAQLHVPNVASVPNEFELWIGDVRHKAKIIWKEVGRIGVAWSD
jgi:hypothetical protein